MAEEPLPPVEIPWKLAATTQPLSVGEPAETALSLFFFEPDDEALTSQFPDERLVFVKFTATISPASFPAELSRVAASFLGEGIPCLHLLLDLKVRSAGDETATIRPYFHAAAPLARRMVQTGVVGAEAYEGEADGLAIGKSGTQVNETLRSHSNTNTSSASAGLTTLSPIPLLPGLLSLGGSVRSTSTDVASDRAVSQTVDTTARQASEERRELLSHTTRVENIISLLNARYVGTPHLSFSLSPQPLQQLAIDPTDPNLWFQQLLARRSSGLEGIQEFTALVVVPRGTDFCINARLRRVCLLDNPPGPFKLERFIPDFVQLLRMANYLHTTFPIGTPLEELDIDIIGGIQGEGPFRRPVIEQWALLSNVVAARVASPGPIIGNEVRGSANYKHFFEAWLETVLDEYERALARSPLERGVLFGENRFLDTCFGVQPEEGPLVVTSSNATVSPLFRVDIRPEVLDIGGTKTATARQTASVRARALETTTRWNALERQLRTLLARGSSAPEVPLAANEPALVAILLEVWRKLPAEDPRNVDVDAAITLLRLGEAHGRVLKAAGAARLSDIAGLLFAVPVAERLRQQAVRVSAQPPPGPPRARARASVKFKRKTPPEPTEPPDVLQPPFSVVEAADILAAISAGLADGGGQGPRG
jgi:hypothetical protein